MPIPSLDALCGTWQAASELTPTAPLSSLRGGCTVGRDVLSVGACTFPPFVGGTASLSYEAPPYADPLRPDHPEPGLPDNLTGWSGRLLLNDLPVAASRSRWCPHRVEREGALLGFTVRTSVSLAANPDDSDDGPK